VTSRQIMTTDDVRRALIRISHEIVEKHGGRFEVRSEPGKGATFRIWLPVKQVDPSAAA